jgi:phosphoribosyl 1,2-cyclic phosphate phosphodiesterase
VLLKIGGKKILIDAGPDYRQQALTYHLNELDGVMLTHAHEDHVGGVDELRIYIIRQKKPIPLLVSDKTLQELKHRFSYIFNASGQGVVTKFETEILDQDRGEVEFVGLKFSYFSYGQMGMQVTGFRYKNFAYVTDICEYPEDIFKDLMGLDTLVLSALRQSATHLHFTVAQAVAFAKKTGAKKTYFTHIAHEIDHETTNSQLPQGIELAYDGLEIPI